MEDTYTDAVAAATGVNASEIEALRTAGMGWGDIAHELGVHPSTLGLGHGKKTGTQAEVTTSTTAIDGIEAEELAEATARNTRNGWSQEKDHLNTRDRDQLTTRSRIHEPGTGLTATGTTAERDQATTRSRIHEPGTGLTATGATAAGHSKAERNADATGDGNTTAGSGNGGGNSTAATPTTAAWQRQQRRQ